MILWKRKYFQMMYTPIIETNERELTDEEMSYIQKAICPICHRGNVLLAGPCGGGAQNVGCSGCLSEFWVAPPFGAKLMDRSLSRMKDVYGLDPNKIPKASKDPLEDELDRDVL